MKPNLNSSIESKYAGFVRAMFNQAGSFQMQQSIRAKTIIFVCQDQLFYHLFSFMDLF